MRSVHWIKAARKDFESFPASAKVRILEALDLAAFGGKADIAKPMHGLGSGVFEVALGFQGNAFRCVYAVQLGDAIWVVHSFQKKSTSGIATPKHDIDLVKRRLALLKDHFK
jgi:phage-related protein